MVPEIQIHDRGRDQWLQIQPQIAVRICAELDGGAGVEGTEVGALLQRRSALGAGGVSLLTATSFIVIFIMIIIIDNIPSYLGIYIVNIGSYNNNTISSKAEVNQSLSSHGRAHSALSLGLYLMATGYIF